MQNLRKSNNSPFSLIVFLFNNFTCAAGIREELYQISRASVREEEGGGGDEEGAGGGGGGEGLIHRPHRWEWELWELRQFSRELELTSRIYLQKVLSWEIIICQSFKQKQVQKKLENLISFLLRDKNTSMFPYFLITPNSLTSIVEAISKQTDKPDRLIWPCNKDLTPGEVVQFPTFQGWIHNIYHLMSVSLK